MKQYLDAILFIILTTICSIVTILSILNEFWDLAFIGGISSIMLGFLSLVYYKAEKTEVKV